MIRLSQCMIVKNEESNIEKALNWGKPIAAEQIVVDTGSTDRTAEIAGKMGAEVYHFEWINDFAAAKNYAIEQAGGDWIAFLDADEYIKDEDIPHILPMLEEIDNDKKRAKQVLAISCPLYNLNDEGKPSQIYTQERIFRNIPSVRYIGKVHEQLTVDDKNIEHTGQFRIMHTGYTNETMAKTNKARRNTELLRSALADNPKDINLKVYLAKSLQTEITAGLCKLDEKVKAAAEAEADKLYREALSKKSKLAEQLKQITYVYFMQKYAGMAGVDTQSHDICTQAVRDFPDDPEILCYYAMALNKKGQHRAAADTLKKCEKTILPDNDNKAPPLKILEVFLPQMILALQGLGDLSGVARYAKIVLTIDKTNLNCLRPYIATLMRNNLSTDEIYNELSHIYDMSSKADLLLIARAAKECGAIDIAKRIVEVAAYLGDY